MVSGFGVINSSEHGQSQNQSFRAFGTSRHCQVKKELTPNGATALALASESGTQEEKQ